MNLLVGCPVSQREWILEDWIAYVERACLEIPVIPGYVFVASENDTKTLSIIDDLAYRRNVRVHLTHEPDRQDIRMWGPKRYQEMVDLRNLLLGIVREKRPDYFLSLDSDILLAPSALAVALDEIGSADAFGFCTYMSEALVLQPGSTPRFENGRELSSMGFFVHNRLNSRQHYETMTETMPVDIIMAAKLMRPSTYTVDYRWHTDGEDVGWSAACKEKGLKFVWSPKAKAKHVFTPAWLNKEDFRAGF